ncbi:MAG: NGG1p interacting factor NIF3 [Candidatus Gygaella obscura]|nr:NGG1p interacting factor NIF3 [Candidatus Gygaella obscura]
MKLNDFYDTVVKIGIKNDPRGLKAVQEKLKENRQQFKKLATKEKRFFDKQELTNPYADTRILNGSRELMVNKVMVGIDIDVSEVLLFDRLKQKQNIDLLISHHPEGMALAGLYDVMSMHKGILAKEGLDPDFTKNLLQERMDLVQRRLLPVNHEKTIDAARLLNVALMSAHTVADNCVTTFLQKLFEKKRPKSIKEVLSILFSIKEYRNAAARKSGPKIIAGKEKDSAGKIFVDMTGGTEGSKDIFGRLSQAGVRTLVCMHLSEDHLKNAKKHSLNVVIAGHISSDTLGLNLLFDEVEKKQKLNFVCCSGFERIRHR